MPTPIRISAGDIQAGGMGGVSKSGSCQKLLNPTIAGAMVPMRVSPVGFAFETIEKVLEQAKQSAEVTHNHPEGIKGAQATALSIFLAREENDKETIRKEITERFDYDLNRTVDEIRPDYYFNESCQETVPEAIIAFLDSDDYEHSIRLAVSLGGDSDTLACITGGIAEAYYRGVPEQIIEETMKIIPEEFLEILDSFKQRCSS